MQDPELFKRIIPIRICTDVIIGILTIISYKISLTGLLNHQYSHLIITIIQSLMYRFRNIIYNIFDRYLALMLADHDKRSFYNVGYSFTYIIDVFLVYSNLDILKRHQFQSILIILLSPLLNAPFTSGHVSRFNGMLNSKIAGKKIRELERNDLTEYVNEIFTVDLVGIIIFVFNQLVSFSKNRTDDLDLRYVSVQNAFINVLGGLKHNHLDIIQDIIDLCIEKYYGGRPEEKTFNRINRIVISGYYDYNLGPDSVLRVEFGNHDIKLNPKTIVKILGTNGSGKSTLMNQIYAKTQNNSDIKFYNDGLEIMNIGNQIICLGQYNRDLFNHHTTIIDIIRISESSIEEYYVLARELGISDIQLDRIVLYLSGGQIQKVILALMILIGRKFKEFILMFDEPTTYLDSKAVEFIKLTMKELDNPIILITHDVTFEYSESISVSNHIVDL